MRSQTESGRPDNGNQHQVNGASKHQISPPSLSLPKGGGAIRGMGEKFSANPVTGTGSLSVPIATSPGRSGFGPQLSLSYDSGAGNGNLVGSLSIPAIARKTDKGLPTYRDDGRAMIHPLRRRGLGTGSGQPTRDIGRVRWTWIFASSATVRASRGCSPASSDGPISIWGDTLALHLSATTSPPCTVRRRKAASPTPTIPNVFTWLICESFDDKGNVIVYEYAAENADNVDRAQANERNRLRTANRYLKRITMAIRISRLDPSRTCPRQRGCSRWCSTMTSHIIPHPEAEQHRCPHRHHRRNHGPFVQIRFPPTAPGSRCALIAVAAACSCSIACDEHEHA